MIEPHLINISQKLKYFGVCEMIVHQKRRNVKFTKRWHQYYLGHYGKVKFRNYIVAYHEKRTKILQSKILKKSAKCVPSHWQEKMKLRTQILYYSIIIITITTYSMFHYCVLLHNLLWKIKKQSSNENQKTSLLHLMQPIKNL